MIARLQKLTLLLQCLAAAVVWGKANRIPHDPKKILILPAGKLGDIVCTTPVLIALRKRFPNAHLIVESGKKLNERILADSGLADEYIDLKSTKIADLKKYSIDAVLSTGPGFDWLAKVYLAHIPCIISPRVVHGWSPYETRPYKILSHFFIATPFDFYGYGPQERLRTLEPLGITTTDTKKHLGFSNSARTSVDTLLSDVGIHENDRFVCIPPGVGNDLKQWPPERFAAVAEYVVKEYQLPVILIGTNVDRVPADGLIVALKRPEKVFDFLDKLSIDQLKALIARTTMFVGVDTGPLYIAEAFDIPTVGIIGPVSEKTQPPVGKNHISLVPSGERVPQLYVMNMRIHNPDETRRQVLAIQTEHVTVAIATLMQQINHA